MKRDREKKSDCEKNNKMFELKERKPKGRGLYAKHVGKEKEETSEISLVRDRRIFQQLNIKESSASIADAIRVIEMDCLREIENKVVQDVEMAKACYQKK